MTAMTTTQALDRATKMDGLGLQLYLSLHSLVCAVTELGDLPPEARAALIEARLTLAMVSKITAHREAA